MIHFSCNECGAEYEVDDQYGGRRSRCRQCNRQLVIPHAEEPDPLADLAAAAPPPKQWSSDPYGDRERAKREAERDDGTPVRCPKCKSTQVAAHRKGYGLKRAAVGGLMLGPAGLLVGFSGSGKVKITCLKCGKAFYAGKGG